MAFQRSQAKRKFLNLKLPIWKVVDDYTGAFTYSNEVEEDWQGFITRSGMVDPEPAAEHPIPPSETDGVFRREDL